MTVKEMLKGLGERDAYDFFIWISFISTKINCSDCIDICVTSNRIPDCSKCVPTKKLINKAKRLLEEKERQKNGKKTSKE